MAGRLGSFGGWAGVILEPPALVVGLDDVAVVSVIHSGTVIANPRGHTAACPWCQPASRRMRSRR